ncbi:hypothetical protein [Treponema primitia]|uniref:hypothetical protein n=1 Tax=Treponema primitia TaxID=88058 RepID=UPI0012FE5E32|nr:hypothetical protein [Treponema primitia]
MKTTGGRAVLAAVSPQSQSVESLNSGEVKHSKGAKKGALGVFAKLLAGLTRKTKAGGEEAGKIETEGLVSTEKIAKAAKDAAGKNAKLSAEDKNVLSAGNEKIQNRDRRLLFAMQGEGDALSPAELLKEAAAKKTKLAKESGEGEGDNDSLPAAIALSQGLLNDQSLTGIHPGEGADLADQHNILEFSGANDRFQDLKDLRNIARELPENGAETAVNAELSQLAQGKGRNPGGVEKKEKGSATAAETKNSKKNRERITLEVQDLRTEGNGAVLNPGQEIKSGANAGAERVVDIAVELKNNGRSREYMELGQEKSPGRAFEDILARELHQNLNGDIVRQASIMVKDGGEGPLNFPSNPSLWEW